MSIINIKVSDYTDMPGGRYRSDGEYSGEEFRENYLEKHFRDSSVEKIIVDLDGVECYLQSFLDEAFVKLVCTFSKTLVLEKLQLVSRERTYLIPEIYALIKES